MFLKAPGRFFFKFQLKAEKRTPDDKKARGIFNLLRAFAFYGKIQIVSAEHGFVFNAKPVTAYVRRQNHIFRTCLPKTGKSGMTKS